MRRDQVTPDLFDTPLKPASGAGALAGIKTRIAHQMSAVIRDGALDRYEISARMSALTGEDVSKTMLDAYTAESRDDQNIPAYRLLAFIAATGAFAMLDGLALALGCRVLVGEEAQLAALAQAKFERDRIDRHIKTMERAMRAKRG